jgi:hypothetical protein
MTNTATNKEMGNSASNRLSEQERVRTTRFINQHLHAKTGPEITANTVITAN